MICLLILRHCFCLNQVLAIREALLISNDAEFWYDRFGIVRIWKGKLAKLYEGCDVLAALQ